MNNCLSKLHGSLVGEIHPHSQAVGGTPVERATLATLLAILEQMETLNATLNKTLTEAEQENERDAQPE